MLSPEPQPGWGASATTAPPNPFQSAKPPHPVNPFLKQPPNPFSTSNQPTTQGPIYNPFAPSPVPFNPFAPTESSSSKRSSSPSSKQVPDGRKTPRNPFDTVKQASSTSNSAFTRTSRSSSHSPASHSPGEVAELVQPAWANRSGKSAALDSGSAASAKWRIGSDGQNMAHNSEIFSGPMGSAQKRSAAAVFPPNTQTASSHGIQNGPPAKHDGRSYELANKIQQQLTKDRIKPPPWPANPGSHAQRQAMESFRESYKLYREKARKSLIKAGLIDDPNQRRTLEQALDFRGISEDMCPEWEKVTRIIEYDIRNPEKAPDDSGDFVAKPSLMVKRLARSAAGQDAPLPMDVRSFATLRKTLDYLIDDLIPDDSLLPSKHNFLWDRTRAIRIDLSVQKYNLTPDERADLLYCLETIARFHVTALHLLSQDGFAAEDFSEQQEIEQLGKTLISLKELYDDCVSQGIECANEAEFRGYYIVFNARNPSIKETVEGWGPRLWNTDGIRTAMCLVESLQNTWTMQGPLHPYAPTELALSAAAIFFSIVSSPQISYTMACFAEIHFNDVRKSMLHMIRGSYTRPREGPKDITPTFLKERMRFDTEDEAVDFAEKHGFVFDQNGADRYAILNSRQSIKDSRIRHAFSETIVERKRSGRSLPDVIHHTLYHQYTDQPTTVVEEGMFVPESEEIPRHAPESLLNDDDTNTPDSTNIFTPQVTTKPPSPDVGNNVASHTHVIASSSSIFSPPTQISESPSTSAPLTVAAPVRDPGSKVTRSIFAQPYTSPKTHLNPISVTGEAQFNTSESTLSPNHASSAALQGGKSATLGSVTSPNIFSLFGQNKVEATNAPASESPSVSIFGALSNPPTLSGTQAGERPPITITKPMTIPPSNLLASSKVPLHTESPSILHSPSLFSQAQPPVAKADDGASTHGPGLSTSPSKPNPNLLYAKQNTNIPNSSSLPANSLSMSPGPRQEKSDIIQNNPSLTASTAMIPRKDPMSDFTRWFVLGDNGLMETELEKYAVEHFLKSTWEDFQSAEKDRVRREEDAQSWAEALKYRHYSLKVTFFYRWLRISRKQRVVKRIKLEKEKARKWNSPHSVALRELAERAKKESAIEEAKELVERRNREHARESAMMRESTQSRQSLDEALLAGQVRDGRAAIFHVDDEDDGASEADMSQTQSLRLRSENQRRRKRGLPPLRRFPKAQTPRPGTKTALLRAISSGTGRDSLSMSTNSLRHSTLSSSFRSSLGFNSSRIAKSRPSVPDPYWRMKANGLVQMPNGEYLHESLALPMLREGKRFPGLGDYGLPPQPSFTPSHSPPAGLYLATQAISPTPIGFLESNGGSSSPSNFEGASQKRKREQPEDDDLAAYRNEAPANRKRAKSSDRASPTTSSADQDFLDSIANLLNKVDAVATSSASKG
ncbi:hypothetical protein GGS21DRAFT_548025 [Xylaria nigripes]|nr:hypothetical protein GGS21DRAFT_548025 [Xylaria nigripes]